MKFKHPHLVTKPIYKDLYFLFVVLIVFTLPYSILLNNVFIILLCIVCLVYIGHNKSFNFRNKKLLLVFLIFYFIHFIGFFNSYGYEEVFDELEQKASLLVFPLALAGGPVLGKKKISTVFAAFALSTTFASLLTFRDGIYPAWYDLSIQEKVILHRPYLGLYSVASFFFLGYLIRGCHSGFGKLFLSLLMMYQIAFLILVLAKMSIIIIVFCVFLSIFLYLLFNKKLRLLVPLFAAVICSITLLATFNKSVPEILTNLLKLEALSWEDHDPLLVNSFNLRFVIWDCSWRVLETDLNWLYGTGVERSNDLLVNCYIEKFGTSFFSDFRYNSHNQYLSNWLKFGLPAFLFFLVKLFILSKSAFRRKKILSIIFVFTIALMCLSESMLEVQKGVVFYSCFGSLLFINRQVEKKEPR